MLAKGESARARPPQHAPGSALAQLMDWRAASSLEAEWRDLAAQAVEANPFYSPALLVPALEAFATDAVKLALVRDARGRLIALAPVAPLRGYSRLPVDYLATWMHPHCFFAAPLIRTGSEALAFAALFELADAGGAFFRLRHLDGDGALFRMARQAATASGRLVAPSAKVSRAILYNDRPADEILQATLSGKKRKELRRQRTRLGELGCVAFETLSARGDLAPWTDEFLKLEAAGWKGAASSAIDSHPRGRRFLEDSLQRAFAAGSLDFHKLSLDGKPVAMIVNFIECSAGYSFKIAYDEALSRYSPGVLLEIEMMRALAASKRASMIDSCAAPDHPMINSLWRGRRTIAALNISGRAPAKKAVFHLLTSLERAGEAVRNRKTPHNEGSADDDL